MTLLCYKVTPTLPQRFPRCGIERPLPVIPRTYEDWRHCIEKDCGLPLTQLFLASRLQALTDLRSHHTQQFVAHYGAEHVERVVGFFRRASSELPRE